MNSLQYNTSRKLLGLREYGRHIQRMVDYLLTIEDREKRNQQARAVIELMGDLNPHLRSVEDYRHMLWDHLFEISDFSLDVDSPYPIPQKDTYKQKGKPMKYPSKHAKYAHLGKNIMQVVKKALKEPDPAKKSAFTSTIAYYMKLSYQMHHKEMVHDEAIRVELLEMTDGQLNLDLSTMKFKQPVLDREEFNRAIIIQNRSDNFGNHAGGDTQNVHNMKSGSKSKSKSNPSREVKSARGADVKNGNSKNSAKSYKKGRY